MTSRETTLDQGLIHELREMARDGATTRQLIDRVRGDYEAAEAVIPILAYLGRAFFVPLPTILPLREDLGTGAFGRAIQVAFWFAALLTRDLDVQPWDWDRFWRKFPGSFSAKDLESLSMAGGYVAFTHPSLSPRDIYARVLFEAYIDKSEAFGPSRREVYDQIQELASTYQKVITQTVPAGDGRPLSMPIKFEYQIADQGPKLHVVCMAQGLREVSSPLAEAASSAT
jgi:hypothetical protein